MGFEPLASRVTSGSTSTTVEGDVQGLSRVSGHRDQDSRRKVPAARERRPGRRRPRAAAAGARRGRGPRASRCAPPSAPVPSLSTTYDERRGQPLRLVEDAVGPGHLAVRPEVREQREVEAVLVGERAQRVDRVAARSPGPRCRRSGTRRAGRGSRPSRRCTRRRTRTGRRPAATAFVPRYDDSVTSWPNWSRSVKSGAGSPSASPVMCAIRTGPSAVRRQGRPSRRRRPARA